jgi:hypothetical protein
MLHQVVAARAPSATSGAAGAICTG